jgi:serine/threonine-protein kinase HipA
MKKLSAYYDGWGEHWLLGTLADNGRDLLFEYSPEALIQGLELSPRSLKLRAAAYGQFPGFLQRLPGLIADALPDGWGLMVMDRLFRKCGRDPLSMSPLDRLAFIGQRALGALSFEPAWEEDLPQEDIELLMLAREAHAVVVGKDTQALRELALLGGSPQGARPKVMVHYDPATSHLSTQPGPGTQPWLVKFQAEKEHKEVCELEDLYAQLARNCQLEMPATKAFDLDKNLAAFGIARFDVEKGLRVPVHSLAGALHVDFRVPQIDYLTFLRATRLFTRDEREVQKAYERAVFNVLFNNRDDHTKNFAFRLSRDRTWRLAPGYDLTFSDGPGGQHQMDVEGEGGRIQRAQMLQLAQKGGLDQAWAAQVLDRMSDQAGRFKALSGDWKIRKATVGKVHTAIEANRTALG